MLKIRVLRTRCPIIRVAPHLIQSHPIPSNPIQSHLPSPNLIYSIPSNPSHPIPRLSDLPKLPSVLSMLPVLSKPQFQISHAQA